MGASACGAARARRRLLGLGAACATRRAAAALGAQLARGALAGTGFRAAARLAGSVRGFGAGGSGGLRRRGALGRRARAARCRRHGNSASLLLRRSLAGWRGCFCRGGGGGTIGCRCRGGGPLAPAPAPKASALGRGGQERAALLQRERLRVAFLGDLGVLLLEIGRASC